MSGKLNNSRNLADRTSPEVADLARGGAMLAVPVGSTEQHGPHLPLSTDTDLAVELTRRLGELRSDVVIAPAIAYGSSGEHQDFAGTLSIGQDALELLLVELCRSAGATFSRVLLVSTHGGNAAPVRRAEQRLRAESREVFAWMPSWEGDAHAGHVETSMQLAIAPHRVHLERAEVGDQRPIGELLPLLRRGSLAAVSPNGILGDPRTATAEDGRRLLDELFDDLLFSVEAWCADWMA